MEERRPEGGPAGWSGWRLASRSSSEAIRSPRSRRPWPQPSGPVTGWSWSRIPARCCTSRRRTTRWSTRRCGQPMRRSWLWATVSDEAISAFYGAFAARLEDDTAFEVIAGANAADVAAARARGRSTTRLVLSSVMRADMVAGLRTWQDAPSGRGELVERVEHGAWAVEQRRAAARASSASCSRAVPTSSPTPPACCGAATRSCSASGAMPWAPRWRSTTTRSARRWPRPGCRPGAATLLAAPSRATGYALFSHPLLSLAVARGSGEAVAQLGAVARQAGTPVSLHGTGGAWLVGGVGADAGRFEAAVRHSLDRKVCNTLNVCCIVNERAADLVPRFLAALEAAGEQRRRARPAPRGGGERGSGPGRVVRPADRGATGRRVRWPSLRADIVAIGELAREWEWEENPEVTLVVVPDPARCRLALQSVQPTAGGDAAVGRSV